MVGSTNSIPEFVSKPLQVRAGTAKRIWFYLLILLTRLYIRIAFRPSMARPGAPNKQEVDAVYTRHAARYDRIHHIITRGQDLIWRRNAGWALALDSSSSPHVLDLCTGTGLTILEMGRVLAEHARSATFVGLDYNQSMLAVAKSRFSAHPPAGSTSKVSFVRGDATNMTAGRGQDIASDFVKLQPASFDFVSLVFGIGAIGCPRSAFDNVLRLLKEGGRYYLVDMHRPIASLSGEIPIFGRWIKTPQLETYIFMHATVPLALERLWAWRDPTLDFYIAPLECYEEAGKHYGFRILYRFVEPERWWLSLPMLPVCKLLLEKVQIEAAEYHDRQRLLKRLTIMPS
jgi:ubiquinone/menaquinone biosynthesis C-methylase UbiE